MEAPRLLSERSLAGLLREAIDARAEGLVVVRCREGLRHGVWVQHGYVVGAHVAGRFDPLLFLLRERGAMDAATYRACLRLLQETQGRTGEIAGARAGIPRACIGEALRAQLVARLAALLALAQLAGHDAQLERGPVPPHEWSVRMPLGSLLRRIEQGAADGRAASRKHLRTLAKTQHPDRHAQADAATRQRLSDAFALATAAYHGFL